MQKKKKIENVGMGKVSPSRPSDSLFRFVQKKKEFARMVNEFARMVNVSRPREFSIMIFEFFFSGPIVFRSLQEKKKNSQGWGRSVRQRPISLTFLVKPFLVKLY